MPVLSQPFADSLRESNGIGAGPDFPGSSGDRERGKFRPSETPRLTKLAVANDDSERITKTTDALLEEILLYQKATLLALSLLSECEAFSVEEVLAAVSN